MKKQKPILPIEKENLEIREPQQVAAGVKAVAVSFGMGIEEMGLLRCLKTYNKLNTTNGFDCPSCAWPDPAPEDRSAIAEYCENGAKAVAEEATTKRVTPEFFKKYSISEMMTWSELRLGKSGRITHPVVKRPGSDHYEEISWEDAFQRIATKLNGLESPDEAVFYTSGRASNEAAFLYQLFARMLGTNNLPDCSNLCHESSGVGLSEVIGIGKGTVKLEDFYVTDLIIIMGQNPGTNHPRMMSALQKAKRKGAKIISINPLPETGLMQFKNPQEVKGWIGKPTELSDLFLQVRINGDVALLKAIMRVLYDMERKAPGSVFDKEFIENYTADYAAFIADLQQQEVEKLAAICGVPAEKIHEAAAIIQASKRMIICWAMGLTQHRNSVQNVQEVVNLLLLTGSIGLPGAGACPVRGHSNVQGDRSVGVWEHLRPYLKRQLEKTFNFQPPEEDGYNAVKALKAMSEGKVKVYMSLAGNLLLGGPDTGLAARAMENCELTIMVSTKLNRNHLITGDTALILPCLGRTEVDMQESGQQFVSVENSMGIVHQSKGVLEPASEYLKSEPEIIANLAKATFGDKFSVDWDGLIANYDRIRDLIEKCVKGFTDYNKRVRREGGFYLPNGARERRFNTDSGKAHFKVIPLPEWNLATGEFILTSIRSHDQFNTTIYGHDDRYRGVYNARRVIFMNPEDVQEHGLKEGEMIDLISCYNGVERKAEAFKVVPFNIPTRCLAAYFPEANVLVPVDQYDQRSFTPISKSVIVRLEKHQGELT